VGSGSLHQTPVPNAVRRELRHVSRKPTHDLRTNSCSQCDGQVPCGRCSTTSVECVYEVPVRQSKEHMRAEIDQLRAQQRNNDRLLAALVSERSDQILDQLRNGEPLESIMEKLDKSDSHPAVLSDAPGDRDGPVTPTSIQTTEGTAWNQFSGSERQFGITADYDKIETTKITPTPGQQEDTTRSPGFKGPTEIMGEPAARDQRRKEEREAGEQLEGTRTGEQAMALGEEKRRDKSQPGHEQRAPDRTESTGNDPVSPELIARITRITEKVEIERRLPIRTWLRASSFVNIMHSQSSNF